MWRTTSVTIIVVLAALASSGWARDADLEATWEALNTARGALNRADRDYEGHRRHAIEDVGSALDQVEKALTIEKRRDQRREKRTNKAEKKAPSQINP